MWTNQAMMVRQVPLERTESRHKGSPGGYFMDIVSSRDGPSLNAGNDSVELFTGHIGILNISGGVESRGIRLEIFWRTALRRSIETASC